MFTIYDGSTEFNQWDQNQRVTETRLVAGDKVVFLNSSGMTFPMKAYKHEGEVVVDVPNKLLQDALPVVVYINNHSHETRTWFNVVAQDKPDSYAFEDNDDWPSESADVDVDMVIDTLVANGQIGSGEPDKTYTFDGKMADKVYVPYGDNVGFVKISDDIADLHKFKKIVFDGETSLPSNEDVAIQKGTAENGVLFGAEGYILTVGVQPYAVVITSTLGSPIPSTGLYFACGLFDGDGNAMMYTSELVIGGTIKTIDPKYLPSGSGGGGELPVIDLIALGMDCSGIGSGGSAEASMTVSSEVYAELVSILSSRKPIVVKFQMDGHDVEAMFNHEVVRW